MGNIEMDMFIIMHIPKGGSMIGWTHEKIIMNGKISKIGKIEKYIFPFKFFYNYKYVFFHFYPLHDKIYGLKFLLEKKKLDFL